MNYKKTKLNAVVPSTTVEFRSIVNIVVTLPSWNPTVKMVIVKDHRCMGLIRGVVSVR
jgi:hypothetical protein